MHYPDLGVTQLGIISLLKSKYSAVMMKLSEHPKVYIKFLLLCWMRHFFGIKTKRQAYSWSYFNDFSRVTLVMDLV